MYESDALHRRGQALEEMFFRDVDEKLRQKLRESLQRAERKQRLAEVTGFQDNVLLDHLVDANFDAATITALAWVPLVFVAWADGSVTPAERQGVIDEILRRGIGRQPEAHALIQQWLDEHPPEHLWTLWKEYVAALRHGLSPAVVEKLAEGLVDRAETVAQASRTGLSIHRVSQQEQRVLDEIKMACLEAPKQP